MPIVHCKMLEQAINFRPSILFPHFKLSRPDFELAKSCAYSVNSNLPLLKFVSCFGHDYEANPKIVRR